MKIIDADKLMQHIKHKLCISSFDYLLDSEKAIINVIESEPSIEMPTWIPCSEKLPEDPNPSFTYGSKTYQVTTASGAVVALKWCKTEVRGKTVMRWEYSSGVIYHGDALAWKPLSEPWKGADGESI